MTTWIKAGYGIQVGQNFTRLTLDTPIGIDDTVKCRIAGNVIGTIPGIPSSPLAFMRAEFIRVEVPRSAIINA